MIARHIKQARRARRAPWQPAPANAALPAPARAWTNDVVETPEDIAAHIEALATPRALTDVVALHALHGVLRRLERVDAAGAFALRGSMLLRAWVNASMEQAIRGSGAAADSIARQPKDLDFVATRPMPPREAESLLLAVARTAGDDGIVFDASAIARSEAWPYSVVRGLRYQLPWELGRWRGAAQVDIALDETIPLPTQRVTLPGLLVGLDANVEACTPESALAWKLRWLVDDVVTQAKDVWDALCILRYVPVDAGALDTALSCIPAQEGAELRWRLVDIHAPLESHWRELARALSDLGSVNVPATANDATDEVQTRVRTLLEDEK